MYRKLSPALALAMLLSGCAATTVSTDVTKPPKLDLLGIRELELEKFAVKGRTTGTRSAELSLDSFVANVTLKDPTVAGAEPLQEAQRAGLARLLADNGYMQVSEGLDSQATLGGVIEYTLGDSVSEHMRHDDANNRDEEVYTLTRVAHVTLNFTVTAADGRVLVRSKVEDSSSYYDEASGEFWVRQRTPTDATPVVLKAIANANHQLLCMLAPCKVTETHELRGGRSGDIGQGSKAAQAGKWDAAAALWQKSLEPASTKPEDRLAALHNLGVYFEVKGDLEKALASYQQVYAGSGKPDDQAEVERVSQAILDAARLHKLLAEKGTAQHAAPGKK